MKIVRHFIILLTLFLSLTAGQAYAYEIKVIKDGPVSVSGEGVYNSKATCTLKAKTEPGYSFMGWERDGVLVSEYSTYEFVVTDDAIYTAKARANWPTGTLAAGTYTLTSYSDGFIVNNNTGTIYGALGGLVVNDGQTITIQFDNTNIIPFNGELVVKKGNLVLKKIAVHGGSTIKRHPDYFTRFLQVRNVYNNDPTKCTLTLQGYDNGAGTVSHLVINGGDDAYGVEGPDASGNYTANYNHFTNEGNKTKATRCLLLATGGRISINGVELTRNWNSESNGGAIHVTTATNEGDNNSQCRNVITIANSQIKECVTEISSGAAIMIEPKNKVGTTSIGNSSIYMENVEIFKCFSVATGSDKAGEGGVIRTTSNSDCTLSMKNCSIHDNYTNNRGSLTWTSTNASAGTLNLESCNLYNNWTKQSGAALEIEANVEMTGGSIYNNKAKSNGGGVWIHNNSSATLTIKGAVSITGNNTVNGRGGAIYYQNGNINFNGSSFTVTGNTQGSAKAQSTNNIFLCVNRTIAVGANATATGINIGVYTENAASVGTDIPVLTGSASKLTDVYDALLGAARLTDDRNVPQHPKYTRADPVTIYFALTNYDFGPYNKPFAGPISNADSLYKFMCWVNGVNGFGATHPGATGNVTADIDMSGIQNWIPIGESVNYTGTFNGNGHVISGLNISDELYSNYGLFGTTAGATIDGVYVNNCAFEKNTVGAIGCIIGDMQGGTLSNSTCSGTLTSTHASCVVGGLVGTLTSGTLHSSYAGTVQTGYQMGGLAGSNAGNIYNSFANPQFTYSGSGTEYVGGLVGVNNGTVQNCYVRFTRASSLGSARFGQIVGDNNGSVTVCYHPTTYDSSIPADLVDDGSVTSTVYGDVVAPYLYNHSGDNLVGSTSDNLCKVLNTWVTTNSGNGYASWKRTTAGGTAYSATAGNINGDYPIHKYSGYTCAASTDGINLDYAASLDAMLSRHASNATVNLYANEANVTGTTGTNVVVYIDENVSLLQDVSGSKSRTSAIEAYTCQTLPGDPRGWHFVSSSLSNSGIGFTYGPNADFNWEPNPCHVTISTDDDASLFPSDLPKVDGYSDMSRIDLYCFYEPEYHWINLKRNSASHWHMNATTVPITYTNETTLTPGKGYLVSADKDLLLQNKGSLNNGDVEVTLGYSPDQAWAGLLGYNLIGNPYQSYLDFSEFAAQNSSLWFDDSKGKAVEPTYAVYDEAMGGYIQYKEGASRGSKSAPGILNMHQGFMVRSSGATRAKFTNAMRTNDGTTTGIRGAQPAYPLINFTVTDSEGVNDFAVLELGRDADAGAEKLRANDSKGWLYLHYNGEDYGILFRSEVDDYQPLWFEAEEEGTYTLGWETANAEFESLTLVDNITGMVTDMLATGSYTFEANPDQYASRFKIVIGDYKDIEENEGGASTGSAAVTFAYYANGEIHLVETCQGASLQIIDMTGRVILSRDAARHVSTTGMAPGVYVLRLTTEKGTKIQKMVIE